MSSEAFPLASGSASFIRRSRTNWTRTARVRVGEGGGQDEPEGEVRVILDFVVGNDLHECL